MSRKSYSPEEISLISACPYVKSVTPKRVSYTAEFMGIFKEETLSGKRGGDIFREHGLPVEAIGWPSVLQTASNWRFKIAKGVELSDQTGRPRTRDLTQEEIIARQRAKIEMLQQENDFLRQIRRLERRRQPSKSPSRKGSR